MSRTVPGGSLPIEAHLVLCAARSRRDAGASARLQEMVRGDLDWDTVLEIARRHEVTPLLYWSLKMLPPRVVPEEALARLQEACYAAAAHNLLLATELIRLLDHFRANDVLAVPIKGPALAMVAYGHLSLRTFVDLDVLVDPRDVPRVHRLLEIDGYRRRDDLRGLQRLAYLQSECSYDYVREDGRVTVELHWGLMPRYFGFPLRLEHVRDRLDMVPIGSATVPCLAAEDSLLFLCLHGTKHHWSSLKWICDIAESVEAYGPEALDWERLQRYAATLGGERMLRLGLLLAADLLRARLPPDVSRWLRADPTVVSLATEVGSRLFDQPESRTGSANLFYLRAMTSAWKRLRYCLHVATVPTKEDWQRLPLPPVLSFLYYPLHSLWLLERAVLGIRRTGPRDRRARGTAATPVSATGSAGE